MNNFLISQLFISGLLCILILLPLYYLLGYSTLWVVNNVATSRSKHNYSFNFEDVLVTSLATLSLIIIGCKNIAVFPQVRLIFYLSLAISAICLLLGFISKQIFSLQYKVFLPQRKYIAIWFLLFITYLIRSSFKAISLKESIYIPSRFNTDIFLYIRRSLSFLGEPHRLQFEGERSLLEILYSSPKLLSSLIYSSFTYITNDIGIAGTIITSTILAGIILKYIMTITQDGNLDRSPTTIAVILLLVFQPAWCWLQDQFFWSNILCIYLLIYALEDLWQSPKIDNNFPLKFAIAIFALMGFYPSQLPFFLLAGCIGLCLNPSLKKKLAKNTY